MTSTQLLEWESHGLQIVLAFQGQAWRGDASQLHNNRMENFLIQSKKSIN